MGPHQAVQQGAQPLWVVDVLLAVGGDEEVLPTSQLELFQDGAAGELLGVMEQHLLHRRPGEEDPACLHTLGKQVAAGVFGVDEVEVGDMVNEAPVGLLWHVLVEAPVAGLHVVHRNPHPLGHDGGDAAVGVPEDEHGVRLFLEQDLLGLDESVPEDPPEAGGVDLEEVVGLADAELVEEDPAELVVVVLPGVHEDVVDGRVEPRHHP
jgi:hypothetical protein